MNEELNTSPPKTNDYELNKEVDTGQTWINGKSIYRKVFQVKFGNRVTTSTNLQDNNIATLDNVDKIVKVYCDMECTNPNYHTFSLYYEQYWNIASYISYYYSGSTVIIFERHTASEFNGKNITLIVEYTKV